MTMKHTSSMHPVIANTSVDRRSFLRLAGSGASALYVGTASTSLGLMPNIALGDETSNDRFLLQIFVPGGFDPAYLFDSRPRTLIDANLWSFYGKEEPKSWEGANGQSTLVTNATDPLAPWKDRFSVINGVIMTPGFDGHDQNANAYFSGNPFGGESFIPVLNRNVNQQLPMDGIKSGQTFIAAGSGFGQTIAMGLDSAKTLLGRVKAMGDLHQHPISNFTAARFKSTGQAGQGRFSKGATEAANAHGLMLPLADKLTHVSVPTPIENEPPSLTFGRLALEMFRGRIARSAILFAESIAPNFFSDTHDKESAMKTPEAALAYANFYAALFKLLVETPFDDRRSMWDVTTLVINSEFSRTLRGMNGKDPVLERGTDHNPLNNSILIGGGGIKGGMVVGESDIRTPEEVVSEAHLTFDKERFKVMGKPFDFEAYRPRADLMKVYDDKQYLTVASVTNTLYKRFDVPQAKWLTLGRNGPIAKPLDVLIG